MIANRSATRPGSCANRAHMMKSTVSTDLGGTMHADRTAMRNNETWSDFSVGINVDHCYNGEQLSCDAKHEPRRRRKPARFEFPSCLLEPIDKQRPETLRAPGAVPVLPKTCPVRLARSPLAIAR